MEAGGSGSERRAGDGEAERRESRARERHRRRGGVVETSARQDLRVRVNKCGNLTSSGERMLRACACRVSSRSAPIAPDRRAVPRLGFHALFLEVLLWRPYADGDLTRIWRAGGTLHAPKLLCARLSRPLVRTGCARRSAATLFLTRQFGARCAPYRYSQKMVILEPLIIKT
jgi:hypothetical protein